MPSLSPLSFFQGDVGPLGLAGPAGPEVSVPSHETSCSYWAGGKCNTRNIFNDPYTLQHASLAQHHNINFLPTPFSVQFYPLRNNYNPLRPVSHLASSLFWRPQCVLKSEHWSENYYVSFMASKLQANTNRKAACKCMKVSSCTSQFSSIQRDVSENYIWL